MKRGFRALVVDDDTFSRMTAVRILRRIGATSIVEAADGNAALALAEQPGEPIDLVLCDLCMRHLDGIETLGGLASRSPAAMFVLASSADPRLLRAAASSAQRAGIAALQIVNKPVTLAKLQDVLATMGAGEAAEPSPAGDARTHAFSADEIRLGLARGEFTPFYQPKVTVDGSVVCGAEALIRWRHPTHGLLSAGTFMPVAQANGLLSEIFFVALPAAVAECARWVRAGYAGDVSINLPITIIGDRDLPNQLDAFVTENGLAPDRVTFEVTEDSWLHEQDLAREVLTRLRVRGFGLAIDDFGTGYSGVQQLLNAPFNELKIDQGFIRAAPTDPEAAIALDSITALARQLDLRVVAEGVETREQWDIAAAAGCDEIQGYLVAKPLSAAEFQLWLAERAAGRPHVAAPAGILAR